MFGIFEVLTIFDELCPSQCHQSTLHSIPRNRICRYNRNRCFSIIPALMHRLRIILSRFIDRDLNVHWNTKLSKNHCRKFTSESLRRAWCHLSLKNTVSKQLTTYIAFWSTDDNFLFMISSSDIWHEIKSTYLYCNLLLSFARFTSHLILSITASKYRDLRKTDILPGFVALDPEFNMIFTQRQVTKLWCAMAVISCQSWY